MQQNYSLADGRLLVVPSIQQPSPIDVALKTDIPNETLLHIQ